MTVTRTKPQRARWCVCGALRMDHRETISGNGWGKGVPSYVYGRGSCEATKCERFRPGKSPKAELGRSVRNTSKAGYTFEKETEARYSGHRIGRSGNPDVVVDDPKGGELLALECEQSKRAKIPAWMLEKLEQAHRLARGRRGGPVPSFTWKAKLGPGQKATAFTIRLADADAELMRRIEGSE